MIIIELKCDHPNCSATYRSHLSTKSDLLRHARFLSWQIGKSRHLCPLHRTTKPSPNTYQAILANQQLEPITRFASLSAVESVEPKP